MSDTTWTVAMAEAYDRGIGPVVFEPYARQVAARARELAPQVALEIAAGSGIVTDALLEALPSLALTATDLNEAMVDYGRERVPGATWQVADAQALPFPSASFDLVLCQFGVMFFPDKVGAYAEMARVLRPGGSCLIAIWDTLASCQFEAALTDTLAGLFPDDPPDFLARIPHGYADPDQITADVTAGGLELVSLERVVETSSASSAATVADAYCHGSPLRFALEPRGDLEQLTGQVADALTARLGEGPVSGEMSAIVVTARKA